MANLTTSEKLTPMSFVSPFYVNGAQTFSVDASARADGKRVTQRKGDLQELLPGQRICDHCQTVYTYGHARQRFCSEKCRIENWQDKNGKEIRHRINVKA